jgi:hypothetical protein
MKNKFAFAMLAAFLTAASAQASNLNTTSDLRDEGIAPSTAPATILDDIPLMPGLQLDDDKNLVRILPQSGKGYPVITVGILDVDDIYNFYKRTLPPLGWTATSGRDYARGDLSLHINAHADGKLSTVTFTEKSESP